MLIIELSDVVDTFLTLRLFDLHIDDDAIGGWVPEHGDLVLEVVDRELRRRGRHRLRAQSLGHRLYLNHIVLEEVYHLLLSLECMLLSVALEALESLNEVLLLIVRQALNNIDHEYAIAAIAQTLAQIEPFVVRVMDDLRLAPAVDGVVEQDALFEQHVHLVIFWVVADVAPGLFEDIQVDHLAEVGHVDLVDLDRIGRFFLRQQVTIAILELVNEDLIALDVDSAKHAIVRYTHYYHLILVITAIFLL